jgi:hypothetical protein
MKRISFVIAIALAACKGNPPAQKPVDPPKEEPTKEEPVAEGVTCDKELALECPEGQIDGCLKTPVEGTTHACVAN